LFGCVQESQRKFVAAVKKGDVEKVSQFTNKGLDPNFIDMESGGGQSVQTAVMLSLALVLTLASRP